MDAHRERAVDRLFRLQCLKCGAEFFRAPEGRFREQAREEGELVGACPTWGDDQRLEVSAPRAPAPPGSTCRLRSADGLRRDSISPRRRHTVSGPTRPSRGRPSRSTDPNR